MVRNPKLNIYTLQLNPKDDSVQTFRDLFECKYGSGKSDDDLFKLYFQDIVNEIGDKNFRKDDINKKVIGKTNNSSVPQLTNKNPYIDGVIEGGKFGIRRELADTDNKNKKSIIQENAAVLDLYYLLLYTPLNSQFGFLLIQSYTEETVQDSIKDFVKNFFSYNGSFYKIKIDPYIPKDFVDRYINASKISMFGFTTKTTLSESLRDNTLIGEQTFEVEIKIKPSPKSTLIPDTNRTDKILEEFSKKCFDGHPLEEGKKTIYLTDDNKRKAHYDLGRTLQEIKPTIYLEDYGISCDPQTGVPDFKAIQSYSVDLLEEIKKEFNQPTNIHEF